MISPVVAALGDSALLLPASAFLLVYLAILRLPRLALAFLAALAFDGAGTVAAKLVFHACGHALADDVVSPSGHTSFATLFYGSLALMLGAGRPAALRWALGLGATLIVLAVGVSRVRTGAHTPEEVGIGLSIGALAYGIFALLHARAGRQDVPWAPVAIGFGLALAVLGGSHFSLEGAIGRMARTLSRTLDVCASPERGAGPVAPSRVAVAPWLPSSTQERSESAGLR